MISKIERSLFTVFVLLLHYLTSAPARMVAMTSRGHVLVLNAGQTMAVVCSFHTDEFNLFDNPVLWKKTQRDEETQVNIMGNLFEPFLSTGRFELTFEIAEAPKYCLTLKISDVTLADSGNYTCEVRGRKSVILAKVTYYVFVRADVNDVRLGHSFPSTYLNHSLSFQNVTNLITDISSPVSDRDSNILTFIENTPTKVTCTSTGGYPPPVMTLTLGSRDVTDFFTLKHSSTLIGQRGLRLIGYTTTSWTERMTVSADDDGSDVTCSATVPGMAPSVVHGRVVVLHAPQILCRPTSAYFTERNAYLTCEVKARPDILRLHWIIDSNGTRVTEGGVTNNFWTLVTDLGDGLLETRLYMKLVLKSYFRVFVVLAENSIGATRHSVSLLQRKKPTSSHVTQTYDVISPMDVIAPANVIVHDLSHKDVTLHNASLGGGKYVTAVTSQAILNEKILFVTAIIYVLFNLS